MVAVCTTYAVDSLAQQTEELHVTTYIPPYLSFSNRPGAIDSMKKIRSRYLLQNRTGSVNCPPNIDFEEGSFNHWICDTGFVRGLDFLDTPRNNQYLPGVFGTTTTGQNEVVMSVSGPMPNRHVLIQNIGAPVPLDPYGGFPVYPPDGSGFAVKLGSSLPFPGEQFPMARAERITYVLTVPANVTDYALTYQYAVVFQDPGHVPENQPRFTVKLFDPQAGSYVPCGSVSYVADSTIPGFQLSPNSPRGEDVWYKPWSPVFINLARYRGRTLYLEFTTEDCTQGGHWGYAYLDVNGCEVAATAKTDCSVPRRTLLKGPPGFLAYNWWNADYSGLLATGQNAVTATSLPLNTTLHLEIVAASGSNCRDTLTLSVTRDTLIYNHDADKNICRDSTVSIGTGLTIPNCMYSWTPAPILSGQNQPFAQVQPSVSTEYYLLVKDTISNCTARDTVFVRVNPSPLLAANDTSICSGNSVTLTVSGADTYSWSPSNGLNQTSSSTVTASPASTQTYTVTGTLNSSGCSASKDIVVTVNPAPQGTLTLPPDSFICEGGEVLLDCPSAANAYQWYLNGQPIAGAVQSSYHATEPGGYSVQLFSSQGCSSMASGLVALELFRKPLLDFSFPTTCVRLPLQFTNGSDTTQSGQVDWLWDFGDGSQSTLFQPVHTYINADGYTVTLTAIPRRCPASVTTYQEWVHAETPTPGIRYPDVDALINTNTQLHARAISGSCLWRPSFGLNNPNVPDPVFHFNLPVEYKIRFTSAAGCVTTDTQLVRVQPAINIQVPTAFSPNGDGHNDLLDVFLTGIDELKFFRVFNRWGQLLFETNDPRQLWDGTFKGKRQPPETYVWTAEGTGVNGQDIIRRGQTILLR